MTNASYLLLKNGDILEKFYDSPYEIDVAESKRKHAKYWHKWEKRGNKIIFKKNNGKEYIWEKWYETVPAKKGETIDGAFKSIDPIGGDWWYSFNTIEFKKNGEFVAGQLKGPGSSWKTVITESGQRGTYVLDRYTITLKPEGGPEKSFLFFFYPDDHQYFVIGRSHFLPLDE